MEYWYHNMWDLRKGSLWNQIYPFHESFLHLIAYLSILWQYRRNLFLLQSKYHKRNHLDPIIHVSKSRISNLVHLDIYVQDIYLMLSNRYLYVNIENCYLSARLMPQVNNLYGLKGSLYEHFHIPQSELKQLEDHVTLLEVIKQRFEDLK